MNPLRAPEGLPRLSRPQAVVRPCCPAPCGAGWESRAIGLLTWQGGIDSLLLHLLATWCALPGPAPRWGTLLQVAGLLRLVSRRQRGRAWRAVQELRDAHPAGVASHRQLAGLCAAQLHAGEQVPTARLLLQEGMRRSGFGAWAHRSVAWQPGGAASKTQAWQQRGAPPLPQRGACTPRSQSGLACNCGSPAAPVRRAQLLLAAPPPGPGAQALQAAAPQQQLRRQGCRPAWRCCGCACRGAAAPPPAPAERASCQLAAPQRVHPPGWCPAWSCCARAGC